MSLHETLMAALRELPKPVDEAAVRECVRRTLVGRPEAAQTQKWLDSNKGHLLAMLNG